MIRKLIVKLTALSLLAAGCSSEELLSTDVDTGEPRESRYLTVNVLSASGTRASDDDLYESGSDEENAVDNVRFYFFTSSGEAAQIRTGESSGEPGMLKSYVDFENPTTSSTGATSNVEKFLTVNINFESPDKANEPKSVVAVLNSSAALGSDNLSLAELKTRIGDYAAMANAETPVFVMSNAIYADNANKAVVSSDISGHIFSDLSVAQSNPVNIYVERAVAKIRMRVGMDGKPGKQPGDPDIFDTGTAYDIVDMGTDDAASTDGHIYVKFLGWNATATTDAAYLLKSIDPEWDADLFGGSLANHWNDPDRQRSFWAINPKDVGINYIAFEEDGNADDETAGQAEDNSVCKMPLTKTSNSIYVQENAAEHGSDTVEEGKNTIIIVGAQLVNQDSEPITLAEWGYSYFTPEGIKKLAAQEVDLWKKLPENGGFRMVKIAPEDIEFKTATELGKTGERNEGSSLVYPVLKNREAGNNYWYADDKGENPQNFEEADEAVMNLGAIKLWKDGYTYYFVGVEHLGEAGTEGNPAKPGHLGVVRNHIYDTVVTKVKGLGTPVYDPSEKIYPEIPDDDETVLTAKINVITWRIVKKSFGIEW